MDQSPGNDLVFTPTPVVPGPPKKSYTWLLILVLFLLASGLSFFAWESYRLRSQLAQVIQPSPSGTALPLPSLSPSPSVEPIATQSAENADYAGWETYTNTQYGFELRYPSNFKALTDKENLYGWPKAIVLFYSGGQSYDLPVEVWNSEAEYQQKYQPANYSWSVIKTKDNKFITLINANSDPIVSKMIDSFRFID